MAVPRWLKCVLQHHGIPYEERHHPAVHSASHLAQMEHVSGYRVAKTVFLTDGGHPLTLVVPACARVDLDRVRSVVSNPDLRFASEKEITGWFKGCEAGAIPPLRIRSDQAIFMDRSLAHFGRMLFAAGTSEDAVEVRFRDWYRAVRPGVGRFAEAARGEASSNGSDTVLVVEDEPDTNQLLCQLLESRGVACHGALAGRQALDLAARDHPSAILLDLMLPDVDGFAVYEQLRRTGPIKRIPVIIVTALDDEAARQRGQQLGADAYLIKPFEPEELVSEVRCLLADAHA